LIPAKDLVNGHSIVAVMPDGRPTIDYFHIALDSHEVISAEGVDAESLLIRNGEHEHFSNFVEYDRLGVREAMTPCAPQFCYAGGRSHLAALLRLGISNFVNVRDPIQKVEQKLTALAARSAEYAN
jgi:hypothetical protein